MYESLDSEKIFGAVCWAVWLERNCRIFKEKRKAWKGDPGHQPSFVVLDRGGLLLTA